MQEAVPEKMWLRAETASVQARTNGHCYLELCQQEDGRLLAKARAVIWKGIWPALRRYFYEATGSDLAAGMQILARVQVSFSELYGLTLVIDELEPRFTLGAAEMEKRRTLERLQKEGLMEKQKSLSLTPLPWRLAVISARDAAGYGDFCMHLEGNEAGYRFRTDLFEALMQGEKAPESIIDAIQRAEAEVDPEGRPVYDAVLILRGGGARLDLAFADDYGLAFTIAGCSLPVLTAIGHDRDVSVADLVAYDYVKTPTALADYFIDLLAAQDARLDLLEKGVQSAVEARIRNEEQALSLLEGRILAADPRRLLSGGYALVADGSGKIRKTVAGIASGEVLKLHFSDGTVEVKVLSVNKKD